MVAVSTISRIVSQATTRYIRSSRTTTFNAAMTSTTVVKSEVFEGVSAVAVVSEEPDVAAVLAALAVDVNSIETAEAIKPE